MTVAVEQLGLLWLGESPPPGNVVAAIGADRRITCRHPNDALAGLASADLVMIAPSREGFDARRFSRLLDDVDLSNAVAIVLLPADLPGRETMARRRGQYVLMDAGAAPGEIAAAVNAAAALQPTIRNLQNDVAAIRSFGCQIPQALEEVDEELRLAARLQRDFLPRSLPSVDPVSFATLFRPAGWVSGDIYDVFRLDEHHVGFYVADVVGHGMPAALLTMFLKRALQTKRIVGHSYEILPPDAALAQLNEDMCDQELTSCQFCTAVYGIVNVRTLQLRYARAGHPVPLLLGADGELRRLDAVGALLGVFPGEAFQTCEVLLARGERLLVFSDGLEDTLCPGNRADGSALMEVIDPFRHLAAAEMLLHLAGSIDESRGENVEGDDVTVLVMDVAAETDHPAAAG